MHDRHSISHFAVLISALCCTLITRCNAAGELTPPYFNLAEGRRITASSTCGVGIEGRELYCKLVGSHTDDQQNNTLLEFGEIMPSSPSRSPGHVVIQGQQCDYCSVDSHPVENAIDGTEKWWQSPPLSRGMKFNEVNLTIDFGQEFHVAYIFIRMGNSPRPGLWTLEKSNDYGKTWSSWQHFSDSHSDCDTYFGAKSLKPINKDDDIICTTEFSKIVPLENGEIIVRLLTGRPSANNYFNSTILQEWTRATNVRIRLLRTKNLLGHLMSVARQDPTVTRRYFYSIKDISIGGRCMCNGHANTCSLLNPHDPARILACSCQHNTCGNQCEKCCPGFEQKKWQQNTNARPFLCEPCNCHGHSDRCVYDEETDEKSLSLDMRGNYEGGGICQDCRHNTQGINCNECKPRYFRPYGRHWNETDVCESCNCDFFYSTGNCAEGSGKCECRVEFQGPDCDSCAEGYFGYPNCRPCECNLNGTNGYHCESTEGKCPCKVNFGGDFCKECAPGYYGYPECKPCNCELLGSSSDICDVNSGQCECKLGFSGQQCDECKNGYFNSGTADYPKCNPCKCDVHGTVEEVCDKSSGSCICKEGFGGPRCDQCQPGFSPNFPDCVPCNCSAAGSTQNICDRNGKCPCLSNFAGKRCDQCMTGYYNYPECLPCHCDHGSVGISCNHEGQCTCQANFDGKTCNQCKESFYNYPLCESCDCNPAGVADNFPGCGSVPVGALCSCKERVEGRICDKCRPLYWNLNISNPNACEECDCHTDGTIGALETCESKSGQCNCKRNVQGRICDECTDGTFDLFGSSLFGCKPCDCDVGGSASQVCNKATGDCRCHPRIAGRDCSRPVQLHYFPTLYQFKYEYEDGYTSTGAQVRYQFDEEEFPGFSKIGYAYFSPIQSEVTNDIDIQKSSVYRLIVRFLNKNPEPVVADISIISENPANPDQYGKILFKQNEKPEFVTMSGVKGDIATPIVLDPGRYSITIKSPSPLFLDYFVILPAAYYEASILTKKVINPCKYNEDTDLCRLYKYPAITQFTPTYEAHTVTSEGSYEAAEFYRNFEHLAVLKENELPIITPDQNVLNYVMRVPQTGQYVLVVDYITDENYGEGGFLSVNQDGERDQDGIVLIYPCVYSFVCRGPVTDKESREKVFIIDANEKNSVILNGADNVRGVAIKSITAIPYDQWSVDYIRPKGVCVRKNEECVEASFPHPPDSKKVEFESEQEEKIAENLPEIASNSTKVVLINKDDPTILVQSRVDDPGRFAIIVKYYQPSHPKFKTIYRIETERQNFDGKLTLEHCPSTSGCRAVLQQDNGFAWFEIDDEFQFSLSNMQDKGVWLDNILLVPVEYFNDRYLVEEEFDLTGEFLRECGQDSFNIQLNASSFCKSAVYSLTSEYNHGALSCACNTDGSTSLECDPFGGQCQCKPNIIGRQCEACKTGFYGFPDCKPCDCPSTAICEKYTGECLCPPKVTGEKCDQCEPDTFGFDKIIGCEDCNCNQYGVLNGNMQCDLNNGSCICGPNIIGRGCEKCAFGYHSFPHCDICRCDLRGTTLEVCDQDDETCFCKKNVEGRECSHCAAGTYNLQEKNPEGCTRCFCFGKTTRCENAYLRQMNVSMLNDMTLHTINITKTGLVKNLKWIVDPTEPILVNEATAQVYLADATNPELNDGYQYFGFIELFGNQNNHLTAYGGYLNYNLNYTTHMFGSPQIGPDVILEGKEMILKHTNYRQPAAGENFHGAVEIVESNFQVSNNAPVTREQFMMVLRDLKRIYIRASYFDKGLMTYLSDVTLTLADEDPDNYHEYREIPSEKCECPAGYQGLSCEDCAKGYYRDPNGPFGGYCIPCECNGHADSCDCNTGVCQNCQHHTTGDHCDQCVEGFYGNATNGSPYDCMICACPLPIESNNFATGCEVSEDGYRISCDCKPGYAGHKCQSCANGFYGSPETEGEICRPCECSGNIDPSIPGACDSVTGECMNCLNNTAGTACNLCAPGYYGDAILLKDCKSCICDNIGTAYCDNFAGTCVCQPNVEGDKCDRCALDHFGFDSGYGCAPCECGVASNSTQCEDSTGECACKPGVGGRQCDRCLPGYWNYGENGCEPCSCNSELSKGLGCNPVTGQCECLRDVIGEKCDSCPPRWVLVEDYGCTKCDGCVHGLLDVTDGLKKKIDPVIDELNTIAKSYYTTQKLKRLNEETEELKPEVEQLNPKNNNLNKQVNEIDALESDAMNHKKQAGYHKLTAEKLRAQSEDLLDAINNEKEDYRTVFNDVGNTIEEVHELANSLGSSDDSAKLDQVVREATDYLDLINAFNSSSLKKAPSKEQSCIIGEVLQEVEKFAKPVEEQEKKLDEFLTAREDFDKKIEDLRQKSRESQLSALLAENLNKKNRDARLNQKLDNIDNSIEEANKKLKEARIFELDGKKLLANHDLSIKELEELKKQLDDMNEDAEKVLPKNEEEYKKLQKLLKDVYEKVEKLIEKKNEIEDNINLSSSDRSDAIKAVHAYAEIGANVEISANKSKEAEIAAKTSKDLTEGIVEKACESLVDSNELSHEAQDALKIVQTDLSPRMQRSDDNINRLSANLASAEKTLKNVDDSLNTIKPEPLTNTWRAIELDALNSNDDVARSREILEPIYETLDNSTELAQKIPKDIEDTNKDIAQALSQVDRFAASIPDVQNAIDSLEEKQDNLDRLSSKIGEDMERLRRQIAQARQLANGVKVGVEFMPNTTLELAPPQNLPSQAFNTKFSTFFKTRNPNGLLMFIGNEQKPNQRSKRDDYMAIEIENGYPVLIVDFGDGPERIINTKKVDDDRWYEAIVERNGKNVKFVIREEDETGKDKVTTKEEILNSDTSHFDLDENSRLIVGGYSDFQMPDSVKQSSFEGEIQDLKIGDESVGLWNFVDGQNLHGSKERDELATKEAVHTGYRFGGNGYVALNAKPFNFKQRSHISFNFKAAHDAADGLLFFVGKEPNYLAIRLMSGTVVFEFKMGQLNEEVKMSTQNTFNDDQWHRVEVTREGGNGALKVDDREIFQQALFDAKSKYEHPEEIYVGGYPPKQFHSKAYGNGFDGCIDDLHIDSQPIDLSRNKHSSDVLPGCPMKFSSVVAFHLDKYGFTHHKNFTVGNKLHINLKFKTSQSKGLIFYGMNADQSSSISLTLEQGVLVLRSSKMELNTEEKTWNDGQWHVVTATHDERRLRLYIDDTYEYTSIEAPPTLIVTNGDIYFGGLPSDFKATKGALPNTAYFVGCIQDVTINTNTVNFAHAQSKSNAVLNQCPRDILDYEVGGSTIHFPDGRTEVQEEVFNVDVRRPDDDMENVIPGREDEEDVKPQTPPTTTTTTARPTRPTQKTTTAASSDVEKVEKPEIKYTPEEKHPECALPVLPSYDVDYESGGYRFGTAIESFIELQPILDVGATSYNFSLAFRTIRPYGLLFYASDDRHTDFISLHLVDGYVYYKFSCGGNAITIQSDKQYDNNVWNEINFSRDTAELALKINGADEGSDRLTKKCRNMELRKNYLVGGAPNETIENVALNIGSDRKELEKNAYFGCVKDIKLNGAPIAAEEPRNSVLPCSDNTEKGTFFGKSGGYVKLREKFNVGDNIKIHMEIKPRNLTGLLTSVHGKKSFLIVEMVNGNIHFTVDSGDGPRATVFFSDEDRSLCDGNWHTVTVIKAKHIISINVDGFDSEPNVGHPKNHKTLQTTRPLFLGGHPHLERIRGMKGRHNYQGCIRTFRINDEVFKIDPWMTLGNVEVGVCPLS